MAESKIAVYGAIAANSAIAVTKFIVAGVTGSSAMLSEAVHSTVDTGNGILLLIGMSRSQQPATPKHPFGHGKELYFWSLIVAVLIFGLGGGISFYEGVQHVLAPVPLTDPFWNYVVLAAAAVFEGASLGVALHQFQSEKGPRPFWRALHTSKDPSTYTVIAEDSAALLGLLIAGAGVWASHTFQLPVLDGVASILIGLLLAGVAVLLVSEARGLLVGEGVRPETAEQLRQLALRPDEVRSASMPLTMYMGPDDVLLAMDVAFRNGTPAEQTARVVNAIERDMRAQFPRIRRIYIEAHEERDDPNDVPLPTPST
ncbi:MAG: cation diffusion facilitator family transporter [Burkholderiales bacterium]